MRNRLRVYIHAIVSRRLGQINGSLVYSKTMREAPPAGVLLYMLTAISLGTIVCEYYVAAAHSRAIIIVSRQNADFYLISSPIS